MPTNCSCAICMFRLTAQGFPAMGTFIPITRLAAGFCAPCEESLREQSGALDHGDLLLVRHDLLWSLSEDLAESAAEEGNQATSVNSCDGDEQLVCRICAFRTTLGFRPELARAMSALGWVTSGICPPCMSFLALHRPKRGRP